MGIIKIPQKAIAHFEENYPEIFSTGELAEGKWNRRVGEWTKNYTGAQGAVAVGSNGSGIFTILSLLKRYRGYKYVFLQSNTMYGVKTMSLSAGLEISGYVDCGLDTLMPTFQNFKKFVLQLDNPSEHIFLLTHIGGWVNPDIKKIANFCKEIGIALVEDCAHSFGSTLNGEHTGTFGDAGVYSLYATKAVSAGEGGVIVSNDDELAELASRFIIYDRFSQELDVGINLRMSEISALLAYSVLNSIEEIISNKYMISDKYIQACEKAGLEYYEPKINGQRSNLYKFILIARDDEHQKKIDQIKTRTSTVYDYSLGNDPENICNRHICLPIWYDLDSETINQVLSEIKNIA